MEAGKIVLNVGAIIAYIIDAWGDLPGLDSLRTNWIKHGVRGLCALVGLVLLVPDPFTQSSACPWSIIGVVLVAIGDFLSIPLLVLVILFWTHRISDSARFESLAKHMDRAANLLIGLGLILQLSVQ